MMAHSGLIGGSVLVGTVIAVVWFHAPVIPAVLGGIGAGCALYFQAQRRKR